MRLFWYCLSLAWLFAVAPVQAQETFPVNDVQHVRDKHYAFTHARIVTRAGTVLEDATLVTKKGMIEAVGQNVPVPTEAVEVDLSGKTIYPAFIDPFSIYGIEVKAQEGGGRGGKPQFISDKPGAYGWNEAIRSEYDAYRHFEADKKEAEQLRKLGFGAAVSFNRDGIARGSAVLVSLGDRRENEVILKDRAAAHYSFDKGTSGQDYPGSLMGAMALLRQTYLDAEWYRPTSTDPSTEYNISLHAWNQSQDLPQLFEVKSWRSALRAVRIANEFDVKYIIKGAGDEYQRVEALKNTDASFILPLNFPKAYDVEDPHDARKVSLADMKHWETAPANPALLEKAGIPFAFTTADLDKPGLFLKNLRKAVRYGLSKDVALRALTETPARMLQVSDKLGTLERGKVANFFIASGDIFEPEHLIYQTWVQGEPYTVSDIMEDIRGAYNFTSTAGDATLHVKGKTAKPSAELVWNDTTKAKVSLKLKDELITLSYAQPKTTDTSQPHVRLSGWQTPLGWEGQGQWPDGEWFDWQAEKTAAFEPDSNDQEKSKPEWGEITYPFEAYGYTNAPSQETVLFKNATVWTNEVAGILESADVLIRNGRIAKVGKNLEAENARVLDAAGKHLTSGIIDEHAHIAIERGVNEHTQAVTAEVRIGDVVNPEDINIYRQLAGGVTAAQLLHGSANPIGGQSQIIKFRWGALPEDTKFPNATPFIKFALGENVKQSNWGPDQTVRFPQTRMGVEQVFHDAFTRARDYERRWNAYNNLSRRRQRSTAPPRKDLELETLLEILREKRFISCHSYVQSEINMLMHVAESFGFAVNTFTHILEGYKVADKMKAHGAGGSTFADWWAYKYEVIEAIPYNAAIMDRVGVVTAINSDDAEMGRRLNQEAAKVVKYGGTSEEAAWKMVTLNPARLLHIDHRTGSIRAGKDADLVLWSDHPLSIYAKAEQTYVDGRKYFDIERDRELRKEVQAERMRLIQKMIKAKKDGAATQKAKSSGQKEYHCETVEP